MTHAEDLVKQSPLNIQPVNSHSPRPIETALFFLVVRVYIHLLITALHIGSGEPFGSSQHALCGVNLGQKKTVFLGDIV
jgi:hypothetical protein